MSAFSASIAAALAAARRVDGELVVYVSFEHGRVEASASPARTVVEAADASAGVTVRSRVSDFLLASSDLVDAEGEFFDPEDGDTVERTVTHADGRRELHVHEVMPPSAVEASWRFTDDQCSEIRLHTRLVDRRTLGQEGDSE